MFNLMRALLLALFALPQVFSSCTDSTTFTFGTYDYNNSLTTRTCAWIVANNGATAKRQEFFCTFEYEGKIVQDECPVACNACPPTSSPTTTFSPSASPTQQPSLACVDSSLRLKIPTVGTRPLPFVSRYCSWVGQQDTNNRCALPGVSAACPVTCNACSTCKDPDELRFKFEYNGKEIVRNCEYVGRIAGKVWGRCTASESICRSTCGVC